MVVSLLEFKLMVIEGAKEKKEAAGNSAIPLLAERSTKAIDSNCERRLGTCVRLLLFTRSSISGLTPGVRK